MITMVGIYGPLYHTGSGKNTLFQESNHLIFMGARMIFFIMHYYFEKIQVLSFFILIFIYKKYSQYFFLIAYSVFYFLKISILPIYFKFQPSCPPPPAIKIKWKFLKKDKIFSNIIMFKISVQVNIKEFSFDN